MQRAEPFIYDLVAMIPRLKGKDVGR